MEPPLVAYHIIKPPGGDNVYLLPNRELLEIYNKHAGSPYIDLWVQLLQDAKTIRVTPLEATRIKGRTFEARGDFDHKKATDVLIALGLRGAHTSFNATGGRMKRIAVFVISQLSTLFAIYLIMHLEDNYMRVPTFSTFFEYVEEIQNAWTARDQSFKEFYGLFVKRPVPDIIDGRFAYQNPDDIKTALRILDYMREIADAKGDGLLLNSTDVGALDVTQFAGLVKVLQGKIVFPSHEKMTMALFNDASVTASFSPHGDGVMATNLLHDLVDKATPVFRDGRRDMTRYRVPGILNFITVRRGASRYYGLLTGNMTEEEDSKSSWLEIGGNIMTWIPMDIFDKFVQEVPVLESALEVLPDNWKVLLPFSGESDYTVYRLQATAVVLVASMMRNARITIRNPPYGPSLEDAVFQRTKFIDVLSSVQLTKVLWQIVNLYTIEDLPGNENVYKNIHLLAEDAVLFNIMFVAAMEALKRTEYNLGARRRETKLNEGIKWIIPILIHIIHLTRDAHTFKEVISALTDSKAGLTVCSVVLLITQHLSATTLPTKRSLLSAIGMLSVAKWSKVPLLAAFPDLSSIPLLMPAPE
jgi:hypothetical protein